MLEMHIFLQGNKKEKKVNYLKTKKNYIHKMNFCVGCMYKSSFDISNS